MQVSVIAIARLLDNAAAVQIEQAASHAGIDIHTAASQITDTLEVGLLRELEAMYQAPANEFSALFEESAEARHERLSAINRAMVLVQRINAM